MSHYLQDGTVILRIEGRKAADEFESRLSLIVPEGKKAVVLCDSDAELNLEATAGAVPRIDLVNLDRARALTVMFRYPPAFFCKVKSHFCSEGKRVCAAFFGFDSLSSEIFKAFASVFAATDTGEDGLIKEVSTDCVFSVSAEEKRLYRGGYSKFNFFVDSHADDADFYEMPQKNLSTVFAEGDCDAVQRLCRDNMQIFVFAVVANGDVSRAQRVERLLKEKGADCVVFCDGAEEKGQILSMPSEKESVETYLCLCRIAYGRDLVYGGAFTRSLGEAERRFKTSSAAPVKKLSNVYAATALREVLLECGYDCAEEGENAAVDFYALYDEGNPRKYVAGNVVYDLRTTRTCGLRTALAVREHFRWNGYMAACGFVPAAKSEYALKGKDKLFEEGKHVNLTTWRGLADFGRDEAVRKGTDEEKEDVRKYDYQLIDEAQRLLAYVDKKIIKARR